MVIMKRTTWQSIWIFLRLGMVFAFLMSSLYTLLALKHEYESIGPTKRRPRSEPQPGASYIVRRRFTDSQKKSIFILGAVGKNSTPTSRWGQFAVYGQWYDANKYTVKSLRCCFKYSDKAVIENSVIDFDQPTYEALIKAPLRLWHATCANPYRKNHSIPSLVSIARDCSCSSPYVNYIRPYLTLRRPPEHITINTKMAYGNINPETVVSFLENARYLGFDKVVIYIIDNINPRTEQIIRYYASTGLVECHKFELAEKKLPRPCCQPQYVSDEWLVKRDALERHMGSEYYGIFDMDEYLIPSGNRTSKQLLRSLRKTYPHASTFAFTNKHFLTDYTDRTCTPICTQFKRHIKTPPHEFDYNLIHTKLISITSRVKTQSIHNHNVTPLKGYVQQVCPKEDAFVAHFGPCDRKFFYHLSHVCDFKEKWVEDRSAAIWSNNTIEGTVLKTLEMFHP